VKIGKEIEIVRRKDIKHFRDLEIYSLCGGNGNECCEILLLISFLSNLLIFLSSFLTVRLNAMKKKADSFCLPSS